MSAMDDFVPEADRQEQDQEVEPHEPPTPVSDDIEVPEADALEQSRPVPMSEDEQ
jgi:hypothetical protein